MLLLALDTSTAVVTVALLGAGPGPDAAEPALLATRDVAGGRRHGETLAPAIAATLAQAGADRRELTRLAVGVGPGPFTGLRVGMVTALSFGAALGIGVDGVCSLDALATDTGDCVVATDARRREVYWARYSGGRRVAGPDVWTPAVLAEALAADPPDVLRGPGADLYADVFADQPREAGVPLRAEAIGRRAIAGQTLPVVPLYLRRPDAVAPAVRKAVTPSDA